jgi:hypothetical protein
MAPFRRVFITSDWRLGGTADTPRQPGTGICRSAAALGDFIDWVRHEADGAGRPPVELIVNGDIVDFLAPDAAFEPRIWLGEPDACKRLNEIVAGSPAPFVALSRLLRHPRCSLTLLLGNHGVELSLPAVRHYLGEEVLRSDGRRLQFLFDGEACVRGCLLVEHGNRYDPLNAGRFQPPAAGTLSPCARPPGPGG